MALPFLNGANKRDQLISIDLGGRTTKAVHLQRKNDAFVLSRYALLDAPIYEKNLSADLLGEHLKNVFQALDAKTKFVTLAVGVNDSLVRHADLPLMPIGDMRQILKNNTKNYLQQDLPGHVFDCFIIPPRGLPKHADKTKTSGLSVKQKVLVAGAKWTEALGLHDRCGLEAGGTAAAFGRNDHPATDHRVLAKFGHPKSSWEQARAND